MTGKRCSHIWYKLFQIDNETFFYCMKCLKRMKVNDWDRKIIPIRIPNENEELNKKIIILKRELAGYLNSEQLDIIDEVFK